jgi:subtilase family serine protease
MVKLSISTISAEVILKSTSGKSMSSAKEPITSDNIEEFRPSDLVVNDATKHLKQLGFAVSSNGLTLTIEGEESLFEKVFKINLTLKRNGDTGRINIHSDKELLIPARLSDIIERVVFVPPPELF